MPTDRTPRSPAMLVSAPVGGPPLAPVPAGWASLAGSALPAAGPQRWRAASLLASACSDPGAVAWFWTVARTAGDEELADLVEQLPCGLELTSHAVVVLADDLAGPCSARRAPSHAALLRRLRPAHAGSDDLCTLVASAPGVHLEVLEVALRHLEAAGHPSRAVLLRVAARAVDDGAPEHARALVRSLAQGCDASVPDPLLAVLRPRPASSTPGEPPRPLAAEPAAPPAAPPAAQPWWRRR